MTDDRMRRFAQWQDGLTLGILEKSLPAIDDDLPTGTAVITGPRWVRRTGPRRPRLRHPRR